MFGLFSTAFADDDDMAFGIELGTQCFDLFRRRRFRAVCRFLLAGIRLSWCPVAAVFEEVLGPVDEVGEFGKGAAGDDVGAAVGGGFTRPLMTRRFLRVEFDNGLLQKAVFLCWHRGG